MVCLKSCIKTYYHKCTFWQKGFTELIPHNLLWPRGIIDAQSIKPGFDSLRSFSTIAIRIFLFYLIKKHRWRRLLDLPVASQPRQVVTSSAKPWTEEAPPTKAAGWRSAQQETASWGKKKSPVKTSVIMKPVNPD